MSFLFLCPKPTVDPRQVELNLGSLFVEFFELYGRKFNYDLVGISVRNGGKYFRKRDVQFDGGPARNQGSLCMENPLNTVKNLTLLHSLFSPSYTPPISLSLFSHFYKDFTLLHAPARTNFVLVCPLFSPSLPPYLWCFTSY